MLPSIHFCRLNLLIVNRKLIVKMIMILARFYYQIVCSLNLALNQHAISSSLLYIVIYKALNLFYNCSCFRWLIWLHIFLSKPEYKVQNTKQLIETPIASSCSFWSTGLVPPKTSKHFQYVSTFTGDWHYALLPGTFGKMLFLYNKCMKTILKFILCITD